MNAKERFYSGLAKETIGKITSNTDNWTSFLRTMSRNYEFTYPEQVMIYAQRPNATFCKPYEDWNAENYRRYVKRGSTGIALFVMNRDKPYLRYVFDVADTGVRRSSPDMAATGMNITRLRINAGLSVKDLADIFGFATPQAVYKWQHGVAMPTLDNLVVLAAVFGVSMDEIIA